MTLPSLLLGILLSSLYAALFHLWRGGGFGRLLLYVLLSWAGFWVGHALGNYFNLAIDSLGSLHLGAASISSFVFLFLGYWLSLVEVQRR